MSDERTLLPWVPGSNLGPAELTSRWYNIQVKLFRPRKSLSAEHSTRISVGYGGPARGQARSCDCEQQSIQWNWWRELACAPAGVRYRHLFSDSDHWQTRIWAPLTGRAGGSHTRPARDNGRPGRTGRPQARQQETVLGLPFSSTGYDWDTSPGQSE